MLNEKKQTLLSRSSAAWIALALVPTVAILFCFLRKILMMNRFVFGDDYQMLKWFHEGPIALSLPELVRDRIGYGRFYPLHCQNFNLVSLLNPHLTLSGFAKYCFYVQGGMWILCGMAFTVLMTLIAKTEKAGHRVWWLFLPLALLTMLGTPAFISYFMMLIFPETLLCVLFPLFFLFYFLAYKKEKTAYYLLAWGAATAAIFCKESVISFFAVICGVWGVFGWKLLTRKHQLFLAGLLVSIGSFLLLYYFIVFHHVVEAYNAARPGGVTLLRIGAIFGNYPIWLFAFLLGIFRLIRVVFYREKKHLFMDAMLFTALGFFLSYLLLKLTDWWYWGLGAVVLMPVFFYWLIVCQKTWCKIAIFLAAPFCLAVSVKPAYESMNQMLLAQREDPAFLTQIDSESGVKKILFPALGSGEQCLIEDACYQYLKMFLEKLGTPGKWENNVLWCQELPERLTPEELCVFWRGAAIPEEWRYRLQMNGFQRIASCGYYEAFACRSTELEEAWAALPTAERRIPCKAPFCRLGKGFAVPEEWGCWTAGKQAELAVAIPPELRGKNLETAWDVYAFVHEKSPERRFRILTDGKVLYDGRSDQFSAGFTLNVPAEYTRTTYLPLAIEIENPVSPKALGVSEDPRTLGLGLRSITLQEKRRPLPPSGSR